MRVPHVHRIRGIGGSERHLLTLLPALAEQGLDVSFVGLDDPEGRLGEFYASLEGSHVPFARIPAPRDADPALAWRLARALTRCRADLVHTHLVHADLYGALASRAPLVSTKHNDDPFRGGAFRLVERLLARRARRMISITEALKRFNVERVGLPAAKIDVVHYGIDGVPTAWAANPPIELPAGARMLLAVARLERQKGVDIAIEALRQVHEQHPEAVLVVLGEGPEREALAGLARRIGVGDAVLLPGRVGDVAWFLRRCELLVHPARWEGFGLALLEAMSASRPVVATNVSSIPEIVVDRQTGLLVPPEDARAVARAVGALLEDRSLAAGYGEAGARRAAEEFSAAAMARKTIEVYERALGPSPRSEAR